MDLMGRRRLMMAMAMPASNDFFSKVEVHTFTLSGISNPDYATISQTISHNLGVAPDFVLLYPKTRYIPAPSSNRRILQYCLYTGLANNLVSGDYVQGYSGLIRVYTNASNGKYIQLDNVNSYALINNVTAQDIHIGGSAINNCGIVNGDYVVVIGKIADDYAQGEQTVYNN